MEGPGKSVFVQYIKPDLGAARSRRIEVGESFHMFSSTSTSSSLFFYLSFYFSIFLYTFLWLIYFIFAFSRVV